MKKHWKSIENLVRVCNKKKQVKIRQRNQVKSDEKQAKSDKKQVKSDTKQVASDKKQVKSDKTSKIG